MAETTKSKERNPHVEEARKHMRAAGDAWKQSMEDLLPKGFVENRRTARREFLLAVRSLVDAAIERTEKK